MGNMVKPSPAGEGFLHLWYTRIPLGAVVAVFTPGKNTSCLHLVPVPSQPCFRLMFLCKSPAFAFLSVPPGYNLPADCLNLIPHFVMLDNAIIVYGFAVAVDKLHVSPFLPV